jgi:hypothetical protein
MQSRIFADCSKTSQIGNKNYWLLEHLGNGGERHENLGKRQPDNKICGQYDCRHGAVAAGRIVFSVVGAWMSKGKEHTSLQLNLLCAIANIIYTHSVNERN